MIGGALSMRTELRRAADRPASFSPIPYTHEYHSDVLLRLDVVGDVHLRRFCPVPVVASSTSEFLRPFSLLVGSV